MRVSLGCMVMLVLMCSLVAVPARAEETARRPILAVAPLVVDGSRFDHPEPLAVADVLRQSGREQADYLTLRLKEAGRYFDVRSAVASSPITFASLGAGRQPTGVPGQATFTFDPAAVADICQRTVADQLLVVVLYGTQQKEKRWDRGRLNYLTADYSVVTATALLLSSQGTVIWSYNLPADPAWLPLDYANFDEAYYNMSDKVRILPLTVQGIERRLQEKEKSVFSRPSPTPKIYKELFNHLIGKLLARGA